MAHIMLSILLHAASINAQCSRYVECDDCVEDDDDVTFQKCEWNKADDYCYDWYDEPNQNSNIASTTSQCPAVMTTVMTGIIIFVIVVVTLGVIYVVCKKRNTSSRKQQTIPPQVVKPKIVQMQPETALDEEQPLKNDDHMPTQNDTYGAHQGNGAKYNYIPVAPSATGELNEEDVNIKEGIEGVANVANVANDDRYSEIKQWFNTAVNLKADNEEYFGIFIEFGYDDMSLIKEITETELDQMGITKMAHKKRILSAIEAIIL
eukprot:1002454_1